VEYQHLHSDGMISSTGEHAKEFRDAPRYGGFHDPRGMLHFRDLPCPMVNVNYPMELVRVSCGFTIIASAETGEEGGRKGGKEGKRELLQRSSSLCTNMWPGRRFKYRSHRDKRGDEANPRYSSLTVRLGWIIHYLWRSLFYRAQNELVVCCKQ